MSDDGFRPSRDIAKVFEEMPGPERLQMERRLTVLAESLQGQQFRSAFQEIRDGSRMAEEELASIGFPKPADVSGWVDIANIIGDDAHEMTLATIHERAKAWA